MMFCLVLEVGGKISTTSQTSRFMNCYSFQCSTAEGEAEMLFGKCCLGEENENELMWYQTFEPVQRQ